MIPILLLLLPMLQIGAPGNPSVPQSCGLLSGQIVNTITNQEPWYCPISNQVTHEWESWLPVMLVVTMISFLLSAVILMAGVALGSAKIRSYGVAELYEAIATAIIVIAFVYICAVLFGLGPGNLVAKINPYATAFNLLGTTISSAQGMYLNIYKIYFPLAGVASTSISFPSPSAGIREASPTLNKAIASKTFGAGAGTIASAFSYIISLFFLDPANALANILLQGMAVLYAEYYLLVFFSVAAIPAFLIPGIIFRAILPTRGLGGVMIAVAIGFFLVMPSLFATVFYFTAPGAIRGMTVASAQMQGIAVTGQPITNPNSPAILALTGAQQSLSGFWMLVLFYPLLIIAFTYSFIIELSKLIGGTYQRGAMGRLRRFI